MCNDKEEILCSVDRVSQSNKTLFVIISTDYGVNEEDIDSGIAVLWSML
jgi:hypothetical protein